MKVATSHPFNVLNNSLIELIMDKHISNTVSHIKQGCLRVQRASQAEQQENAVLLSVKSNMRLLFLFYAINVYVNLLVVETHVSRDRS